ncbi:ABC transporter permease subunit [Nonomuraea sp. NPDC059023]|uniref:ABC transporter permease subunit n=1 Tax=unclassified Nonomuraea TaxID=2593643 RepID=UPI0036BEE913
MSVAFGRMVRAEWTKLRTVRAWTAGLAAGLLAIVALAVATAAASTTSCGMNDTVVACPAPPIGPGGQAVRDLPSFVHRELRGDGSITVRVASLRGAAPWAKAGLLVKDGTRPGASYAAVMVTAGHGVRLQHDFTEDLAGGPGAAPRWLRLTRTGQDVTGAESADGRQWRTLGTVRPAGLGARVRVGMFVASPEQPPEGADPGGAAATGVFDHLTLHGDAPGQAWTPPDGGAVTEAAGVYTVSGGGDIAPVGAHGGATLQQLLTGVVLALIAVIVVATVFVTAEYRRGLIAVSLLASPRRGRVLAAKAVVAGTVTFAGALAVLVASALVAVPLLRANGNLVLPVPALTQAGVLAGTAALVALTAVLAVGLGAWLRRAAPAVILAVAAVVLPYVLATTSLLPPPVGQWLLRVSPAAGFAVQQSVPAYPHVPGSALPQEGYFPLPGWAGLAVLSAYTALALALGARRLGRGDA